MQNYFQCAVVGQHLVRFIENSDIHMLEQCMIFETHLCCVVTLVVGAPHCLMSATSPQTEMQSFFVVF